MYHPKVDFHSLRATFITAATNAGVSHEILQVIVGHAPRDVTSVYRKALDVKVLSRAVNSVSYKGLTLPQQLRGDRRQVGRRVAPRP